MSVGHPGAHGPPRGTPRGAAQVAAGAREQRGRPPRSASRHDSSTLVQPLRTGRARPARRVRVSAPPARAPAWVVALSSPPLALPSAAGDWCADYTTPGSESKAAAELLDERFPQRSPDTVDVVWQARTPRRPRRGHRAGRAPGAPRHRPAPRRDAADVSPDGTIARRAHAAHRAARRVPDRTGNAMLDLARATRPAGRRAVELGGIVIQPTQQGATPPRPSAWRSRPSSCCSRSAPWSRPASRWPRAVRPRHLLGADRRCWPR